MKYNFTIKNLDCANCALKIENELKRDKNIKSATVNFVTQKLRIEVNNLANVKQYIQNIIDTVDGEVKIYEENIDEEESISFDIFRLIIGSILFLCGYLFKDYVLISNLIYLCAIIFLLYKTFRNALKSLVFSKSITENFLITISCIGAFLIGETFEGFMVILLYEIGKILEFKALNRSRRAIVELMEIKPEYVNLKDEDEIKLVVPEQVEIDSIIIIRTGEKVALDGVIIRGDANLNTSVVTGESTLKRVTSGDEILSGSIVEDGLLEVRVMKKYKDSTVNKILELVETATDQKAKTETIVSRLAKIYTPIVILLSILIIIVGTLFTNFAFSDLLYKALVFLVISCPCSIVISVPLSYFIGIGCASKEGILIKGSNFLDQLQYIKTIFFDKTGTLTTGNFQNLKLELIDKTYSEFYIKSLIKESEKLSNHPLAKSLVKIIDKSKKLPISNFKEIKGKGLTFNVDEDEIIIGNSIICNTFDNGANFYISINKKLVACAYLDDIMKEDTSSTISTLKQMGIVTKILTGDSKEKSEKFAKEVSIDNIYYELLPQEKYKFFKQYIDKEGTFVAYVGDGINDAPTIALAPIGISMGITGTNSSIEASDIVIMTDELSKIPKVINLSKNVSKIIRQNLLIAISCKIIILILSLLGICSMLAAVFADVGVTLITILNSFRIKT